MDQGSNATALKKKRLRKPRGRGLRTNTGCLTCRRRHKKCDEKRPVCGPCKVASRDCAFPYDLDSQASLDMQSHSHHYGDTPQHEEPIEPVNAPRPAHHLLPTPPSPSDFSFEGHQPASTGLARHDTTQFACSPDTVASELWTADFASTRWLGLLATDAAQADSGFSLAPSPAPDDGESLAFGNFQTRLIDVPELERKIWQLDRNITLTSHEAILFRHFAERSARWLDLFDPQRLFSTYSVRLALRNTGLMKAILALSAKHRSKSQGVCRGFDAYTAENGDAASDKEDQEWIRYYYETLHYVQEALTCNSYTHSEELLATAIVISAYEMLDETDGQGNWQRHLKGVFWIQRAQNVDGGSGGLRQAVWWAWLRQDIWAAFREKRPCLSFWVPIKEYNELDQHELSDRIIYLLSQAVNFAAHSHATPSACTAEASVTFERTRARDELLSKMKLWKSCLGIGYKPLPTSVKSSEVFKPIWVHPAHFGVALQAYSFAKILLTLHSPVPTGFNGYLKMQRTLSETVDTICGIAMELKDEGCQIMSAQCLYGAGLCVHDHTKREKIISLMEACEARVGWAPMATWRDDLRREWAKADGEIGEE